jgi:hypothetical protein
VRKVWVALAEGCPYEGVFRQVFQNLYGFSFEIARILLRPPSLPIML